jgi:hypothetical protein
MFQNHWEIIHKLQEIHQQDLMREAQQIRSYKQAVNSKHSTYPLAWRFYSWLGLQMVSLGSQMQQHYAELAEIPTNLSTDEPCGC